MKKILPPLRYVDIVPMKQEEQQLFCLQDPLGYVQDPLLLSPPAFFVATCLDGNNELETVQKAFAEQFGGHPITEEQVLEVVQVLDRHGYLFTRSFEELRLQTEKDFRELSTRPASIAGSGYPEDGEELRIFLDAFFSHADGPGALPEKTPTQAQPLRGLIAPHIDFQRGGPLYARAYHRLAQGPKPDTVLLFGVAHQGAEVPFITTQKDFETPLGVLKTDQESVATLREATQWDPDANEFLHRSEHSLEFQALMLSYLYGEDLTIIPILCGPMGLSEENPTPAENPPVQAFLKACQEIVTQSEKNILVLAGADLAHVGRRFGDDFDITEAHLQEIEERDREDLAQACTGRADAFFDSVMRDHNERRVCGLGCIYAALKCLETRALTKAEVLGYAHAPDPAGGVVSFAGLALQ